MNLDAIFSNHTPRKRSLTDMEMVRRNVLEVQSNKVEHVEDEDEVAEKSIGSGQKLLKTYSIST